MEKILDGKVALTNMKNIISAVDFTESKEIHPEVNILTDLETASGERSDYLDHQLPHPNHEHHF